MQKRAAGVDVVVESAKKRKVHDDRSNQQLDGANSDLPTPAATMVLGRANHSLSGDDEDVIKVTDRKESGKHKANSRSRRALQQQLDFSRTRDSSSFDAPILLTPSPKTSSSRVGMFRANRGKVKKGHRRVVEISSDEEQLPSPEVQVNNDDIQSEAGQIEQYEEEDESPVRHTRSQRNMAIQSGDDDTVEVSRKAYAIDISGDSDDDMPTTQGKIKRKGRKQEYLKDHFVSSSPLRTSDSDDGQKTSEASRSSRKRRKQLSQEDTDSNDDAPKTSCRRQPKRPRLHTRQEQADLDEDLDFLGPSSDVEALEHQPLSTQDRAKNARKAALERLKKQRARKPETIPEEDEEQGKEGREKVVEGQADSASSSEIEEVLQLTSSRHMFAKDDDDDDFLAEDADENDLLGVPGEMPIQFTKYATQKPKELFKHAVEWMVQRKVNPAFNKHDELYNLTFRKLDNEVQGLAGSKFQSAAWTTEFTVMLKNRPEMAFESIDSLVEELPSHCDACNRSKHPATYRIQFQGKPYNPSTLEEVGNTADDDDDEDDVAENTSSSQDDDNQPAHDWQGNQVPPASTVYQVGSTLR